MRRPAELDDIDRQATVLHVVPYAQWVATVAIARQQIREESLAGVLFGVAVAGLVAYAPSVISVVIAGVAGAASVALAWDGRRQRRRLLVLPGVLPGVLP